MSERRVPPERHHQHRDVTGGWLRPATFGVMDGLVSNVALVAGVAGGGADPDIVVLTGLAGLVAGACSMATGEYTSVSAQRELAQREIGVEAAELRRSPDAERRELAELFRRRGVGRDLAEQVAGDLSRDRDQALRTHAREELGVDPDDLPSARVAAGSSFLAFALGALLPVLPYLLGATTLLPALLLAIAGLFAAGAATAPFTHRSWLFAGCRVLLLGALAAAVTYGIGTALGG